MTTLVCPVCEGPLSSLAVDRSGESFLYPCGTCGVQVWHPAANPGPHWYAADELYHLKAIVDWLGWNHDYGLRSLPSGTRTLLDVGCAEGRFVYAAAARGIDARGIDFSEPLVRRGNERYGGSRLEPATLEEHLARGAGLADVVTCFEVVEHVEDPLGLMRMLGEAVRPGGLVIVSMPNRLGFPHPPKPYDEPPHHLTRWTPAALRELASRAGLEPLHVEFCPPEIAIKAFLLDRFRLGLAARIVRRSRGAARTERRGAGNHDRVRSLMRMKDRLMSLIAKVLAPIIGHWFAGPHMVMLARRP